MANTTMMIATTRISMVIQFSQGCAGSVAGCPIAASNESSGPARKRLNRAVVQTSVSACIDEFDNDFQDHSRRRSEQPQSGRGEVQTKILNYNVSERTDEHDARDEKDVLRPVGCGPAQRFDHALPAPETEVRDGRAHQEGNTGLRSFPNGESCCDDEPQRDNQTRDAAQKSGI